MKRVKPYACTYNFIKRFACWFANFIIYHIPFIIRTTYVLSTVLLPSVFVVEADEETEAAVVISRVSPVPKPCTFVTLNML